MVKSSSFPTEARNDQPAARGVCDSGPGHGREDPRAPKPRDRPRPRPDTPQGQRLRLRYLCLTRGARIRPGKSQVGFGGGGVGEEWLEAGLAGLPNS
jgi:hypothetical protein